MGRNPLNQSLAMRQVLRLSHGMMVSLCSLSAQAIAAEFDIPRAVSEPQLDGRIESAEWQDAIAIDDLHQVRPVEFSEPGERTQFWFKYDRNNLYVAAYAWDSQPERIARNANRQGADIEGDDTLTVLLDAFNNDRSGYRFQVNPNGVRADAIYTSGTDESEDWQGVWRAAAQVHDDGWSMEMVIPFQTLSFDPGNETWGINFWRRLARNNETIGWSSRNGALDPTTSGEMSGLRDLSQGLGLDVIPSLSITDSRDHANNVSESEVRPSLDATYKLGSALNLTVTVNTDFAATEVDGRQLDLSRFSLFFPEQRTFFLTDFDIFSFGGIGAGGVGRGGGGDRNNGMPFFSRRIGLNENREPVDLAGGLKLSGRIGEFDVGALVIRQEEDGAVDATDLVVARVNRTLFDNSTLGAIFTGGDPLSNDDSRTYGVDLALRKDDLPNNRSLDSQIWIQQTDNPGLEGDDRAWSIKVDYPSRDSWALNLGVTELQENFDPRLGFANRVGVRNYDAEFGRNWIFRDNSLLQRFGTELRYGRWTFLDNGDLQEESKQLHLSATSNAGDNIQLQISRETQGLRPGEQPLRRLGIIIPAGEYGYSRWRTQLRSSASRLLSASLTLEAGGYFNGDREGIQASASWHPHARVSLGASIDIDRYRFYGMSAFTRVANLDSEIVLTPNMSLVGLLQYDNLSRDFGINLRFRWEIAPGRDIWLVANHNMTHDPGDYSFEDVQTDLAFKIRYTYRF